MFQIIFISHEKVWPYKLEQIHLLLNCVVRWECVYTIMQKYSIILLQLNIIATSMFPLSTPTPQAHTCTQNKQDNTSLDDWMQTSIWRPFLCILKQSSCSQPAIKLLFSFLNLPLIPLGETSVSFWPHSLRKPMATSTESSVEFSNSKVRISRETTSWAYTTQDSSSPHCNQSTWQLQLNVNSIYIYHQTVF